MISNLTEAQLCYFTLKTVHGKVQDLWQKVGLLFGMMNSILNPIIYAFWYSQFRMRIFQTWKKFLLGIFGNPSKENWWFGENQIWLSVFAYLQFWNIKNVNWKVTIIKTHFLSSGIKKLVHNPETKKLKANNSIWWKSGLFSLTTNRVNSKRMRVLMIPNQFCVSDIVFHFCSTQKEVAFSSRFEMGKKKFFPSSSPKK